MNTHAERTSLAWTRTTLAIIGLAALVIRLRIDHPVLVVAGTVALGALLLTMIMGRRRADGLLPALVVGSVLVVATVELAGIVLR
jgi:uncharacterized membrane protein YidH (DUF202 family)